MTQRTRLMVIHNPASGAKNARRFAKAINALVERGCSIDIRKTTGPGHAEELARMATQIPARPEAVIVAGGDGTLAEVAQGLRGSDLPMGVIPLGTANVFAHEIGLKSGNGAVADAIMGGPSVPIFPGLADGQRFLLMVGSGYDSHAVCALVSAEKKKWGALAYLFAALRVRGDFKTFDVRVSTPSDELRGASIIISRARHFGGPFCAFPDADLTQPVLNTLVLKNAGVGSALKYGFALLLGTLDRFTMVERLSTTDCLQLESQKPGNFQMDGDGCERQQITVSVDTEALYVLMPQ
ncbi:MAG: hypothetical protein JJ879_02475 [Sneathiella sp.]|nr:hypothetical protein [Sneathiella sp.]